MRQRLRKNHLHWAKNWRRPYESNASLLAKCTWLNRCDASMVKKIELDLSSRYGSIYSVINANAPDEWNVPINRLLEECRQDLQVCTLCLMSGYHTDIPQVLGLKMCPIHKQALLAKCRKCSAPIKRFGRAEITRPTIYVCWHCSSPFCETKGSIITDWPKLTNEQIIQSYVLYFSGIANAALACNGFWHLHSKDASAIYYYLTGYICSGLKANFESKHIPKVMQHVSVATYNLPLQESEFDEIVLSINRYEERELRQTLESMIDRFMRQQTASAIQDSPFFHAYTYELKYFRGGDFYKNALSIRDSLLNELHRSSQQYLSVHAFKLPAEYEHQRGLLHKQVLALVTAHSLFNIVRQLDCLEDFCRKEPDTQEQELNTHAYFTKLNDLYTGMMVFRGKERERFVFLNEIGRWLSSFQVMTVNGQPRLRVYRTKIGRMRTQKPYTGKLNQM